GSSLEPDDQRIEVRLRRHRLHRLHLEQQIDQIDRAGRGGSQDGIHDIIPEGVHSPAIVTDALKQKVHNALAALLRRISRPLDAAVDKQVHGVIDVLIDVQAKVFLQHEAHDGGRLTPQGEGSLGSAWYDPAKKKCRDRIQAVSQRQDRSSRRTRQFSLERLWQVLL